MNSKLKSSGQLFVISAPSGAGKTSLVDALLRTDKNLIASISHTTRPKREGEKEGEHYYFCDRAGFIDLQSKSVFLEHATVFGHLYGTSAETVGAHRSKGLDVVLEIDWQGARQVRTNEPSVTSIFVLPPSRSALVERLLYRGKDSSEEIRRRTNLAVDEISHYNEFDYVLVNDDFDMALLELRTIISSVRNGTFFPQSQVSDLVAKLLSDKTRFE
ncbi:MAG: guanylate kinase [Pseudomonadota bacterium]|nr:guanylate kinase [Pseudomonadota bacterium]